jgi:hypothetical protein
MTTIPPSSAVPPGASPSTLSPAGPASPVSPAGGRGAIGNQVPPDSQGTGQQSPGSAASAASDLPDAAPASTIASSIAEGPIVVATVIGPARPTSSDAAAPPSTLPPATSGTQVSLRYAGVLPDVSAAAAGASAGQLVGTLVGRTPAGQIIIDTAIGRLAIAAAIAENAAANAQIAFDIVAIVGRSAPAAALVGSAGLVAPGRRGPAFGPEWPSLRDALEALARIDPALARQLSEVVVPRADSARFLAQILEFLATPTRTAAALLGQTAVDSLRNGARGDLVDRLEDDLKDMSRLNAATDWRVIYVPIFDSTVIRQLRVYTRRRKDPARGAGGSGRFIVEVEFDGTGPLQLDGLVHQPQLDLILRSHVELPAPLQAGISGVFAETCDAAGLVGKLFFQTVPTFPVSPRDEIARGHASGMSV